jgi:hypothetical protein
MVFYTLNLVLEICYVGQPWSRQCGILNISEPYRPPRPGTGMALLFTWFCRSYVSALAKARQRLRTNEAKCSSIEQAETCSSFNMKNV